LPGTLASASDSDKIRTQDDAREDDVGAIRVHEFISLDGVIDTPTWTADYGFDPAMGEDIAASMDGCDGILLGRSTYQLFEPSWSQRTEQDDPGAPFFNDTAKYVVTATLTTPTWRNSEILGPYDAGRIRQLKDSVKALYVSGSGTLVRALIRDGLVDDLHLFMYPVTRAGGPRLFEDGIGPAKWASAGGRRYDNGVVYLHLTPA
jgi:dihydrofolate reductase